MKGLNKIKIALVLSISIGLTLVLASGLVKSQPELPYRPCAGLEIPNEPWLEGSDGGNNQKFCHYNDSVIYIQQDLYKNFQGQYGRRTMSDSYIENIGFTESPPNKVRDTKISFDYYYPSCDGSDKCPDGHCPLDIVNDPEFRNMQWILVGDWEANFSEDSTTFDSAIDDFTLEAMLCGCDKWCHYEVLIGDEYTNDWGSSFDNRNRDLGTIGFEVGNVYLANVKIIGQEETVNVW